MEDDGGTTWDAVTDGQINSASVGAVRYARPNLAPLRQLNEQVANSWM